MGKRSLFAWFFARLEIPTTGNGRQAQRASLRKDFWLYIDEFQNFITLP